jgi:hypothetical protein
VSLLARAGGAADPTVNMDATGARVKIYRVATQKSRTCISEKIPQLRLSIPTKSVSEPNTTVRFDERRPRNEVTGEIKDRLEAIGEQPEPGGAGLEYPPHELMLVPRRVLVLIDEDDGVPPRESPSYCGGVSQQLTREVSDGLEAWLAKVHGPWSQRLHNAKVVGVTRDDVAGE